jgi:hypothetical protein
MNMSLIQEICYGQTHCKESKRNTESMSFVISCRAWKALFPENEDKKKELPILNIKKER